MSELFKQTYIQKGISLIVLVLLLFLLKDAKNIILLTFLFTFLFYLLYQLLINKTNLGHKTIVFLIYGTFISIVSILGYQFAPTVIKQVGDILKNLTVFYVSDYKEFLPEHIYSILSDLDPSQYIRDTASYFVLKIANIGGLIIEIVLSLVLSFFFLLEKEAITSFLLRFENSKISFIYKHFKEFGSSFVNTFGKVLQVQLMIASTNAILSFLGLWFLGFTHKLGLTIMIFFLGMIPVAGVVISLIPLSIIAFQIGGWIKIIEVILMILIIHAIENYFLNPKFFSMRMRIPIFFTFFILIVSELLMGIWGLLLGIPLFMFFLEIAGVSKNEDKKNVENSSG